jgi:hypothetical protein
MSVAFRQHNREQLCYNDAPFLNDSTDATKIVFYFTAPVQSRAVRERHRRPLRKANCSVLQHFSVSGSIQLVREQPCLWDSSGLVLLHSTKSPSVNVADTGIGTQPQRPKTPWNSTWTDRLKRDLLFYYDKFARPAQHTNTTVVNLALTFRHIGLVGLLTSFPLYKSERSFKLHYV